MSQDPISVEYEVEPGDAHNDQMAARARDELNDHIGSAKKTLAQGDESAVMAVIATAFVQNRDIYPHERLASVLAAALVRLAGDDKP